MTLWETSACSRDRFPGRVSWESNSAAKTPRAVSWPSRESMTGWEGLHVRPRGRRMAETARAAWGSCAFMAASAQDKPVLASEKWRGGTYHLTIGGCSCPGAIRGRTLPESLPVHFFTGEGIAAWQHPAFRHGAHAPIVSMPASSSGLRRRPVRPDRRPLEPPSPLGSSSCQNLMSNPCAGFPWP